MTRVKWQEKARRIRWKKRLGAACLGVSLSLACAGVPAQASGETEGLIGFGNMDADVQAFAGPSGRADPGDPYGIYQWALCNTGVLELVPSGTSQSQTAEFEGELSTGPAKGGDGVIQSVKGVDLNILPAWELYAAKEGKRQVVVALIDTGVDYTHADLADAIWVNGDEVPGDGVDNDGNGYVDDVLGWNFYDNNNQIFTGSDDSHGTHSAGTIAAARNGVGIVGICDPAYVKVMVIKTLGTAAGVGTADNVAKAIQYAQANGASICNLSFGTAKYSEELYQVMRDSSMLFVVASGNGDASGKGYDIDSQPVYPASFDLDNIISVANLQFDGQLDSGSNYGAVSVDLAAPGSYILGTMPGNRYSYMSGTSMAAPMVTGAAALLYSYDSSLTTAQVKEKLLASVHPLSRLQGKVAAGGTVDVGAALALCQ